MFVSSVLHGVLLAPERQSTPPKTLAQVVYIWQGAIGHLIDLEEIVRLKRDILNRRIGILFQGHI